MSTVTIAGQHSFKPETPDSEKKSMSYARQGKWIGVALTSRPWIIAAMVLVVTSLSTKAQESPAAEPAPVKKEKPATPAATALEGVLDPLDPSSHWYRETLVRHPELADNATFDQTVRKAGETLLADLYAEMKAKQNPCDPQLQKKIAGMVKKEDYNGIVQLFLSQKRARTQEVSDAAWILDTASLISIGREKIRQGGLLEKTDLLLALQLAQNGIIAKSAITPETYAAYQRVQMMVRYLSRENYKSQVASGQAWYDKHEGRPEASIPGYEAFVQEALRDYQRTLGTSSIGPALVTRRLTEPRPAKDGKKKFVAGRDLDSHDIYYLQLLRAARAEGFRLGSCDEHPLVPPAEKSTEPKAGDQTEN